MTSGAISCEKGWFVSQTSTDPGSCGTVGGFEGIPMARPCLAILYEHQEWFKSLFAQLGRSKSCFCPPLRGELSYDPAARLFPSWTHPREDLGCWISCPPFT